jgi:cell division protein YceG involved in septum cleavage
MDPMQTKDLYFVAKWDGSGAHDFSQTNEEHARKKNEIRRMNDRNQVHVIGEK